MKEFWLNSTKFSNILKALLEYHGASAIINKINLTIRQIIMQRVVMQ